MVRDLDNEARETTSKMGVGHRRSTTMTRIRWETKITSQMWSFLYKVASSSENGLLVFEVEFFNALQRKSCSLKQS